MTNPIHLDTSENFHPYECNGSGKCRHCDRRIIVYTGNEGTSHYEHHPAECALCDPEYDDGPPVARSPLEKSINRMFKATYEPGRRAV